MDKVKMVVTDMDGTLLNSAKRLPNGFTEVYERLRDRGIYFVVASGRQYYTLIEEFNHISHDMSFIAENGGFIVFDGEIRLLDPMKPDDVAGLIKHIRSIEGANIVLCGKKGAYVESSSSRFIDEARKYYFRCMVVDDLLSVKDDVLKVAVNDFDHVETRTLELVKGYDGNIHVSASSKIWLDVMPKGVNKGEALGFLQNKLGISKDETMAFGDYLNDYEMLQMAGYSYAMGNAHEDIKKIAQFQTQSNDEDGVLLVLKELLSC